MIELRNANDLKMEYDAIYETKGIHQMDSYFIWLLSLLDLEQAQRLLDISTGEGQMIRIAEKYGISGYGLDFSFNACRTAKLQNSAKIICADSHKVPFPSDSFDAISVVGSLEHYEDMNMALQEARRTVKSSGIAIFTVPNTFGLRWNVKTAWKTGDVDDDGQPIQRYGTRRQWEDLITKNGFRIIKVLGYEHERAIPRTWKDILQYLRHPTRMISRLFFVPFIPLNAAGQFVFLCKPDNGH